MFQERPDYNSNEYRSWRYGVFTRDKFTCALCPSRGSAIEAHHIVRWADAPHLRYAVSNGITLCKKCHELVTGHESEYEDQFRRIIGLKKINSDGNRRLGKKKGPASVFGNYKWRPRNPYVRY